MGNCAYCVRSKEKRQNKHLLSPISDLTRNTNQLTLIPKPETANNQLSRKTHIKKVSSEYRARNNESIDAPTAIVSKRSKTSENISDIKKALLQHFIFSALPAENLDSLISEMKHYSVGPREIIFKQGDAGSNFFVLSSGTVEIIINNALKGFITKGNGFGELALIHDSERTATIRTVEQVELWGIGRKVFRDALKSLGQLKFEENLKFLEKVPFFSRLTPVQVESLVAVVVNQHFTDNQKIIIEGDPGDLFYIIQQGSVQCSCKNKQIRTLNEGDYFGEQALLYNTYRTATITAIGSVKVLSLGRELLVSVLGDRLQLVMYKNSLRIAFDKCKILQNLNKNQIESIIEQIEVKRFTRDQVIIRAGTRKNKSIWFILKGSLYSANRVVDVFDNIGANWTYEENRERLEEDYLATSESDIGVIRTSQIEIIIQGKLSEKISQNTIVKVIKKVQLFRLLPDSKLESLAPLLKEKEFIDKEIIFHQGDPGDSFYIVKQGEVQVVKDNIVVRIVSEGDYFGERSILLNENRTASVISRGKSSAWMLNRCDFVPIIEDSIKKNLIKRISLQDDSIALSDLFIIKLLGKGTFGNVFLCIKPQSRSFYALKAVSRKNISTHSLQEGIILERKILMQIDHPFIVKLVKTFKDPSRIYFLQEYVQGVGLPEVLRILNLLDSASTRFYAGALILILEHLHLNNIVYRDLKPENIIVDEDGYLKLLDFGTAKIIQGRTYTLIGTPQYMAPEVILGKGYGFAADLWSLGVMIFEFVCGGVPFGEEEEQPVDIYKQIVAGVIVYPKFIKQNCREKVIIEQLLRQNPAMRGTAEHIKGHRWLNGVSWEELISKKRRPPYVPDVEDLNELADATLARPQCFNKEIDLQDRTESLLLKNPRSPLIAWDNEF